MIIDDKYNLSMYVYKILRIGSLQMHLHFSGTEALDIDGNAAEHYREDEGDSAINEHHHIGVVHIVGHEGK